jgi:hypothetical protein
MNRDGNSILGRNSTRVVVDCAWLIACRKSEGVAYLKEQRKMLMLAAGRKIPVGALMECIHLIG